ncbi:radical SAM protein [Geoglobus ahangari]|nr:radical SAM protein [Geoglobus ahangari]
MGLVKVYFGNRVLRKKRPVIFAHMVTFRCNMRCHYCMYWKKSGEEVSLGEVVKMLKEASEEGLAIYTATGGEPLLRNDIEQIVSAARDYGFYTTLVTNGLLLKRRGLSGLDLLTVSLDTLDREKFARITGVNALNEVVDAIKWASERFRMNVNVVVHEENANEIFRLVEFADSLGIGITFEPVSSYFAGCASISPKTLRRTFAEILRLKRDYRCIWNTEGYLRLVMETQNFPCLPYFLLRVNPDGTVIAPCYEVDHVAVGNLTSQTLKSVVSSDAFIKSCEVGECGKCYLLCYVEPSMVFSSLRWAVKSIYGILKA